MATLSEQANFVANTEFQYRVAMACYHHARTVLGEDKATHGHELRINLANSIMQQQVSGFLKYSSIVVTDQDISGMASLNNSNVTDTMIELAIARMWDSIAGVTAPTDNDDEE